MTGKKEVEPKVEPPTLAFSSAAEFEAWVAAHRQDPVGLWLVIAKKGSGIESVSYAEAVQVALCYGWIDGQARGGGDTTWKQRFCPRRPRSVWPYPGQRTGGVRPAARLQTKRRVRRRAHRSRADAARGHRGSGTGQS